MSNSKNEKGRYLEEAAIVLTREGFRIEKLRSDCLYVWWEDGLLCEAMRDGGIAYRSENISTPEREEAKNKVYGIVSTVAQYMAQMESAPFLNAVGLEDKYKVLADFNGVVLAGTPSKHGVQFVTWDWDYDRTGVVHGHYFMENYDAAKRNFATRSGLIQKEQLFSPEQLTEIFRGCADSVDEDFFELTDTGMRTRPPCPAGRSSALPLPAPSFLDAGY